MADPFWLPPVEEGVAKVNQAKKGDADYGVVAYGKAGARDEDFEKKHKRGKKGTKEGGRFVRKGDSGTDVSRAQRALGMSPDGKATAAFASAVIAFQKRHGLKVDGVIGRQTARALAGDVEGARKTSPGAMRGRERRLLRAAAQQGKGSRRRRRRNSSEAPKRARGGALVEDDRLQESPWGLSLNFDESKVVRDFKGKFAKKGLKGGKPGGSKLAAVIPTYDGSKLTFGKRAGGSNGARFASHQDGGKWLVKTYGGNDNRIATELVANAVYREMGAAVPRAGILKLHNGRHGLTYPLVDGKPRPYVFQGRGDHRSPELGKHFMTDALLANWDVAGLEDDNILWAPDGTPFRVDQGGTLEYRAMGQKKDYGPVPLEVLTMLSGSGQARRSMLVTPDGLKAQAKQIAETLTPEKVDAIFDAAPWYDTKMRDRVKENFKRRVAWMGLFAEGKASLPQPKVQESEPVWLAPLQEAILFGWNEHDHPRDRYGKFREKVGGLKAGSSQSIQIDSKTYVKRDKDGSFRVVRSGAIIRGFETEADAARAALDRSAKGKDADSLGGSTKYKDFDDYLKARGIDPDDPTTISGKNASLAELQTEYNRLTVLQGKLKTSGDKYQERAAVDVQRRRENLKRKLDKAAQGGATATTPPEKPKAAPGTSGIADAKVGDFIHNPQTNATFKIIGEHSHQTQNDMWKVALVKPDGTVASESVPMHKTIGVESMKKGFDPEHPLVKGIKQASAVTHSPGGIPLNDEGVPVPGARFKPTGKSTAVFEAVGVVDKNGAKYFRAKRIAGPNVGSTEDWPLPSAVAFAKNPHEAGGGWEHVPGGTLKVPGTSARTPQADPNIPMLKASDYPATYAGADKLKLLLAKPGESAQFTTAEHGVVTATRLDPSSGSNWLWSSSQPGKPDWASHGTKAGLSRIHGSGSYAWPSPGDQFIANMKDIDVPEKKAPGAAPSAPAAPAAKKGKKGKKVGKTVKQANPVDPETGYPTQLKKLALEKGDKVQFKKGGWTYTYEGPAGYGSAMKFTDPKGHPKHWAGYAKPAFIMKASGYEVQPGTPEGVTEAAPSGGAASVQTVVGKIEAGDLLIQGDGGTMSTSKYKVSHSPGAAKPWKLSQQGGMGGSWDYTDADLQGLLSKGVQWSVEKGGGSGASAPKTLTPEQISAKLEPGKGKWANMNALKDGAVFETPAGQIGVVAKGEDAYTGYIAAYDIKTGSKFEPHATNYAPFKASEDPAVMKAAKEQLAKAKGGTSPASSSPSASAVKPAPPKQVHTLTSEHPSWAGGAKSGTAAQNHMQKLQPTIPAQAKSAMKAYTNGSYGTINGGLRKGTISPGQMTTVAALDQAFHDAPPLDVDVVTHRGAQLEDFHGEIAAGKVIQDLGYLSTSPTKPWDKNVQLHMRLKAGMKGALWVDNFSSNSGEKELVVKRGAVMHVLQVEKVGNKTHIYVDVYG